MAERARRGRAAESALVRRARSDGARAARNGQYDEWSFTEEHLLAYAELLRNQETHDVAEEQLRHREQVRAIRAAERAAAATGDIDRLRADSAIGQAAARVERNRDHRETSRAQLDLLTGVHEPIPVDGVDPAPAQRGRWIGPADGKLSPPVPRWLKLPLVVLLAAVEVPIYFESFRAFNPRSVALLWCFTLPVALCMVLGPHLTGVWLRRRHTRPSVGVVPTVASGALMAVWLAAAFILADLRRTTLVTPLVLYGHRVDGPADHLGPTTLLAVFGLVIALSGLISFLLGLADDHPAVAAFAAADRGLRRADAAHEQAIAAHAAGRIRQAERTDDPLESAEEEHEIRVVAIRADYAAAWAAYRDSWSLAVHNPAKTQAVSTAVPRSRTPA